jgi:imidazolonepropionase-like amidohydrolase
MTGEEARQREAHRKGSIMHIRSYRCLAFILLIFGTSPPHAHPGPDAGADSTTVFRNVSVVPMDSERILRNQTVIVKNRVIIAIGDSNTAALPTGAVVIEGSGKYLLPGLADMHVHTESADFPLFLANGITTVREMNGSPDHLKWRAQLASDELLGPRLFVASTMIAGEKQRYRHVLVTSPDQAGKVVKEFAEQHYDFIKVYDGLSRAVYDEIIRTAGQMKIPVVGHIPTEVGLDHALESGQKSIEHAEQIEYATASFDNPLSPQQADAVADRIVRAHAWVTPTLASQEVLCRQGTAWFNALFDRPEMKFVDSSTLSWWNSLKQPHGFSHPDSAKSGEGDLGSRFLSSQVNLVKSLIHGHALLLAGTDTPNPLLVPGFSLHDELRNLHDAGLTNFEALQTATSNPARFLGLLAESGTVEPGKRADLVLVDDNPLNNLETLRTPAGVMLAGKWLSRSKLKELLDSRK